MFLEGAWDGFPCFLNGVVITTSRVATKIKGESCIWKCFVNCPPRIHVVLKKELRILSRLHILQPTSSPEVTLLSSQSK